MARCEYKERHEYKTTYMTHRATRSAIENIKSEMARIREIPGDVLDYTTARSIINHLAELEYKLLEDLNHF